MVHKGRALKKDEYRIPSIVKNKAERHLSNATGRSYKIQKIKKPQHYRSNGLLTQNGFQNSQSTTHSQGFGHLQMNQRAMNLVYTNQANMHNNMVMK